MKGTLTIKATGDNTFLISGHMIWNHVSKVKMLAALLTSLNFNAMDLAVALALAKSDAHSFTGIDIRKPIKEDTTPEEAEP